MGDRRHVRLARKCFADSHFFNKLNLLYYTAWLWVAKQGIYIVLTQFLRFIYGYVSNNPQLYRATWGISNPPSL